MTHRNVAVAGWISLSQVANNDDLPIVRVVWSRSFLCQHGPLSLSWHSPGAEVIISVDLSFVLWRRRSYLVLPSRIPWNSDIWGTLSDWRVGLSSRSVGWLIGIIRGERGRSDPLFLVAWLVRRRSIKDLFLSLYPSLPGTSSIGFG